MVKKGEVLIYELPQKLDHSEQVLCNGGATYQMSHNPVSQETAIHQARGHASGDPIGLQQLPSSCAPIDK